MTANGWCREGEGPSFVSSGSSPSALLETAVLPRRVPTVMYPCPGRASASMQMATVRCRMVSRLPSGGGRRHCRVPLRRGVSAAHRCRCGLLTWSQELNCLRRRVAQEATSISLPVPKRTRSKNKIFPRQDSLSANVNLGISDRHIPTATVLPCLEFDPKRTE